MAIVQPMYDTARSRDASFDESDIDNKRTLIQCKSVMLLLGKNPLVR